MRGCTPPPRPRAFAFALEDEDESPAVGSREQQGSGKALGLGGSRLVAPGSHFSHSPHRSCRPGRQELKQTAPAPGVAISCRPGPGQVGKPSTGRTTQVAVLRALWRKPKGTQVHRKQPYFIGQMKQV